MYFYSLVAQYGSSYGMLHKLMCNLQLMTALTMLWQVFEELIGIMPPQHYTINKVWENWEMGYELSNRL